MNNPIYKSLEITANNVLANSIISKRKFFVQKHNVFIR